MIEELNETNFQRHINSGLKIVEFYANWCGYCKKQFSVLEDLNDIVIGIVDIDANKNLVSQFNISSFPTFVIFKNGIEAGRFSGLHSKYDLMNKFVAFLQ